MWQHQSPPCESQISPTSRYEPEPYIRTTATNGDYDATAETPTATTATTEQGADENNDNGDTQKNMNMQIQKLITDNIESKKCHNYDIYI